MCINCVIISQIFISHHVNVPMRLSKTEKSGAILSVVISPSLTRHLLGWFTKYHCLIISIINSTQDVFRVPYVTTLSFLAKEIHDLNILRHHDDRVRTLLSVFVTGAIYISGERNDSRLTFFLKDTPERVACDPATPR